MYNGCIYPMYNVSMHTHDIHSDIACACIHISVSVSKHSVKQLGFNFCSNSFRVLELCPSLSPICNITLRAFPRGGSQISVLTLCLATTVRSCMKRDSEHPRDQVALEDLVWGACLFLQLSCMIYAVRSLPRGVFISSNLPLLVPSFLCYNLHRSLCMLGSSFCAFVTAPLLGSSSCWIIAQSKDGA